MTKRFINLFLIMCFILILNACQKPGPTTIDQYTVAFETNGGSLIESISVDKDSLIDGLIATARDGYEFMGWYKDLNFTDPWDMMTSTVTMDITLYARWLYPFHQEVTPTYIHNFTTDGFTSEFFTFVGGEIVDLDEPITYKENVFTKAYVFTHESKIQVTPTRDYARIHMIAFTTGSSNYRKVWIRNPIDGTELNFWNDPGLKVSILGQVSEHNIINGDGYGEIHILWMKVVENSIPPVLQEDEHLITLWSYTNDVYTYMVVKDGEKIPELGAPINEGHTFTGWYTNYYFDTKWDFNTPVTEDVFLVAGWVKNNN